MTMETINIKRRIFELIADHHSRLNRLPSPSAIRKFFANQTNDVDLHLEQLQREGLLRFGGTDEDPVSIPHTFPLARRIELGNAPVSVAAADSEESRQSSIVLDLRGAGIAMDGDLYAQIVTDDSMIDAGITTGDVAILKAAEPERGDIVVVTEDGRPALRRYIIVAGIPHVLTENPVRPDLRAAFDEPIQGVLWCLIRTRPDDRASFSRRVSPISYLSKTTTLEEDFLELLQHMLKSVPKAKGQRSTGPSSKSRKPKPETAIVTKKGRVRYDQQRPTPPSRIGLNEAGSSECRAGSGQSFSDEKPDRPYGADFDEALREFAAREK